MTEITKLKIDPVAAVAFLLGAAVILPSLTSLTLTLFAVARALLG